MSFKQISIKVIFAATAALIATSAFAGGGGGGGKGPRTRAILPTSEQVAQTMTPNVSNQNKSRTRVGTKTPGKP